MFRVRAVSVLTLGLALLAASTQAQQPGPYMDQPVHFPPVGYGPQGLPPQGMPTGFDPAYAQAMYDPPMAAPYGVDPVQFQGDVPAPMMNGAPYGGPHGFDGGCGCHGPCAPCAPPPCMPCCEPCPPPCCPTVCSAELELGFLHPDDFNANEVSGVLASPTVPALATYASLDAELNDEIFVTPRLYLHTQKCEWGVGVRFFYLDESVADFTPLSQLQLNILGTYLEERLQTWYGDVETTYSWHHGKHNFGILSDTFFQWSVGLRFLELETDSLAIGTAVLDDVLATTTGVARTEYDGCGITSGFRGSKTLWRHTALYWSVRGSYLNGDIEARTQTVAHAVGVGDAAGAVTVAGADSEDDLVMGEFQLGVQWQHDLRCCPARYFFRVVAEYQHWNFDSGIFAASNANVDIATIPGTQASASTSALARATDLDLVGITIGTGLMW